MRGYLHPLYAYSFQELGEPRALPRCSGWILVRKIPGCDFSDGMSCYPIFVCRDWSQLFLDLEEIGKDLICLSLVTDPFGNYSEAYLRECFPDVMFLFKQHFVVNLRRPIDSFVSSHHQRNVHKALGSVQVEVCSNPHLFLGEWTKLYQNLIQRHHIRGITTFSESIFESQLKVPGIEVLRASAEGKTVGMVLWYVHDNVGYYHLGAYNDRGYELLASFALFWRSIEHFMKIGLEWLSLGAAAGVSENRMDGLSRFKRGWSTDTRNAYFCGRIYDKEKYTLITRPKQANGSDYFPAYRKGEFT